MERQEVPRFWFAMIIVAILWILWIYVDESITSMKTSLFWLGLSIILGYTMFYMLLIAKVKSPKIVFKGGHDTWDPRKTTLIKSPKDSKGNKITFDFMSVEGGGCKAMGFYIPGGGKKGFHVWPNIPGMAEEQYPNLCIRAVTRVCYRGRYQHQKLNFIYKRLKEDADAKGLRLEDDDPIWLYLIPSKEVGLPDDYSEKLSSVKEVIEYFGTIIGDREDEIIAQHQKAMSKHIMDLGPGFWKGANETDTEKQSKGDGQ